MSLCCCIIFPQNARKESCLASEELVLPRKHPWLWEAPHYTRRAISPPEPEHNHVFLRVPQRFSQSVCRCSGCCTKFPPCCRERPDLSIGGGDAVVNPLMSDMNRWDRDTDALMKGPHSFQTLPGGLAMNSRLNLLLRWWKKSLCSDWMETIFNPPPITLKLHSQLLPSINWQTTRCPI